MVLGASGYDLVFLVLYGDRLCIGHNGIPTVESTFCGCIVVRMCDGKERYGTDGNQGDAGQ